MTMTLRQTLAYEPVPLRFGTSGRRGEVIHLTQLEVYLNARAELDYLLSLPPTEGGIRPGDPFYFACDLRPSSTQIVATNAEPNRPSLPRGSLAQAIVRAITDAGLQPVNLGLIPTPALTFYALQHGKGSIMVTGSHIPFDRNGYKTNTSKGELLKKDEAPIEEHVKATRERLYHQSVNDSPFDSNGLLKQNSVLPAPIDSAADFYLQRYRSFFPEDALKGLRLLVYQHSAVGRDLLADLLRSLGAEVLPAGRSDTFVPIDTENIDAAQLATIQALADAAGPIDAVVSLDGDSDRPLLLGLDNRRVRFFGGDLVGMVVAEYLGCDAVVVPISCNDAIDRGSLKDRLQPKTRIGSPYVIAGMDRARAAGKQAVCGWEANGGFLTGSDITRENRTLAALPTRDAFLPLIGALHSAHQQHCTLVQRFDQLPKRFSRAALLKNFPRPASHKIITRFSPPDPGICDVAFSQDKADPRDHQQHPAEPWPAAQAVRQELQDFFPSKDGFGTIVQLNYTDGLRIYMDNGDVAHVRPSGNADELRIYAVADTRERAEQIARLGVQEPNGILRRLQQETEKV